MKISSFPIILSGTTHKLESLIQHRIARKSNFISESPIPENPNQTTRYISANCGVSRAKETLLTSTSRRSRCRISRVLASRRHPGDGSRKGSKIRLGRRESGQRTATANDSSQIGDPGSNWNTVPGEGAKGPRQAGGIREIELLRTFAKRWQTGSRPGDFATGINDAAIIQFGFDAPRFPGRATPENIAEHPVSWTSSSPMEMGRRRSASFSSLLRG